MPDQRDELIAALHQLTAFTEGLLTLSERLRCAYATDARTRPPRSSRPGVTESPVPLCRVCRPPGGGPALHCSWGDARHTLTQTGTGGTAGTLQSRAYVACRVIVIVLPAVQRCFEWKRR